MLKKKESRHQTYYLEQKKWVADIKIQIMTREDLGKQLMQLLVYPVGREAHNLHELEYLLTYTN